MNNFECRVLQAAGSDLAVLSSLPEILYTQTVPEWLLSCRAVLELLHSLDWNPVLQQLGNMSSQDADTARKACQWGAQLCCLAFRACILLLPSELPPW